MIFGKTDEERRVVEQARLRRLMEGYVKFAWLPIKLEDGRYVWFEHVMVRNHAVYEDADGLKLNQFSIHKRDVATLQHKSRQPYQGSV